MSRIAILGAMTEEVEVYRRRFPKAYVSITGVGKTKAAATTQKVISEFRPDYVIFTGLAGALEGNLKMGDLGICISAVDSDIDVRAWKSDYKRGEIPFLKERIFLSHPKLIEIARDSIKDLEVFEGYVATGSKFLDSEGKKKFLTDISELEAEICGLPRVPNLYEMEGSAVLQIANSNEVPCLLLRTISDTLDGKCTEEFNAFIKGSIDNYSGLLDGILSKLK